MIALLSLASALASPPALTAEEVMDHPRWEAASRVLIDGPDSCLELQGAATIDVALFRPGGWLGPGETRKLTARATFTGTLDHGVWTRLDATWEESSSPDSITMSELRPLVGRPATVEGTDEAEHSVSVSSSEESTEVAVSQGASQALGLLDTIIAEIDPDITLAHSTWDPELGAVVLDQVVPLAERGSESFTIRTHFPGGGPPLALDAHFPRRLRSKVQDTGFRVSLLNAQVHLRGASTELGLVPREEGASAVVGALGITVGLAQQISYTAVRPCAVE